MPNSPTSDRHREPTPLALIRQRFARLGEHPVPGLPPGWDQLHADRLAARLLNPQIPAEEVDAVWTQLIEAARTRDDTAVLICAGAALPMLSAITAKLCGHWAYRADTEAMVLVAFLDAVSGLDVARPNVAYRLRWATFHRACPPVRERKAAPTPIDWFPDSGHSGKAVSSPQGHPELLLALAVEEGVLTAAEAGLIIDTRLHPRRLKSIAAEAGIGYAAVAKRRRRAEHRLAAWLRERIADTQVSTRVETAALDTLTHSSDHPADRRPAAPRMSKNRSASRVLPLPKSASSAANPSHEEQRRCA
ncbi:hypothetical protein J2W56_005491 [Nocardia kruczakiae]|uniref:DNA-directed RNA polymerase specialized sigma24 family protein n=1 Tax=Nocardia kruczakiae TaxID=261477 RepID=A0ABU1XME5_9NOCA|nr:hypothetical protein [Nocardia kruczakiae]MDR7171730.1 hypothetical protein [Nocardia kruczakiae]